MKIALKFTTSGNLAYIEFFNYKIDMSIDHDDEIACFLGLDLEEYKERFKKIYDNRFIALSTRYEEEIYLSAEILNSMSKEKVIDKFKEEFCEELTLASM